jgi:hypothetical protein
MNKKLLMVPALMLTLVLVGEGCEDPSTASAVATQQTEQQQVQAAHERQATAVPLPKLNNSLERINIKKRLETFDEPNKVSYIYLINYGRVMAFYTIKGKVTSGGKRLTSTQQQVQSEYIKDSTDMKGGMINRTSIMEAPELDGSYGTSAPYIFFWTTDGSYVQWSSDYMLVDQPLKLTTQPDLIREIK